MILREEPYAAVLESVFRVNHCAHCLKKTPTPIPCFECATVTIFENICENIYVDMMSANHDNMLQVQYCCETCRDLAWAEYHSTECGILSYLEPSRCLGRLPHLALRYHNSSCMYIQATTWASS